MRRPLRLPNFDYASPGAYFITIIVNERAALLGSMNVATGGVELSDVGKMVEHWWFKLPQKFQSVTLDAHAVMPDHFHGVVLLELRGPGAVPVSLPHVMQWFKTMTTAEYFRNVHVSGWPHVNQRLWQRSFYDHVIRSERDLLEIRTYVEGNSGALFEHYAGRTPGSAPTNPAGRTPRSAPTNPAGRTPGSAPTSPAGRTLGSAPTMHVPGRPARSLGAGPRVGPDDKPLHTVNFGRHPDVYGFE